MENQTRDIRQSQWLVLACALIVALASIVDGLPINFIRLGAGAVLAAQALVETRTGRKVFLTSPLFLLSGLSVVLFSLTQGVTPFLLVTPWVGVTDYIGSETERIIVVFAMACLMAHMFVVLRITARSAFDKRLEITRSRTLSNILFTLLIGSTVANVAFFHLLPSEAYALYRPASFLVPPMQVFLLIGLVRQAVDAPRTFKVMAGGVLFLALAGMFAVHLGKTPLYVLTAVWLYWLRLTEFSIKRTLLTCMTFVLLGVLGVQVMEAVRSPETSLVKAERTMEGAVKQFLHVIAVKTILRQTDTGYCLSNVIRQHKNEPFTLSNQLFWAKGLVPRAIWQEKPSLSLGNAYAQKYCAGKPPPPHSSSITLLGQPIIHGGWTALFLHGGLLIIGLGCLVRLSRDPRSLSSAAVVALLPWLIDFDQDFAMYVANAVKFHLAMLPMIFLVGLLERNQTVLRLVPHLERSS